MKKISSFLIMMLLCSFVFNCYAEDKSMDEWSLYVNGALIESEDNVKYNAFVLLPLRTIFEALGATVEWQQETGETVIKYNGETYICEIFNPNSNYYFYIRNKDTGEYVYLTPMSMGGGFNMINDRIYLFKEAGQRLFEGVGCTVEIDYDAKIVKIYDNELSNGELPHWGKGMLRQ